MTLGSIIFPHSAGGIIVSLGLRKIGIKKFKMSTGTKDAHEEACLTTTGMARGPEGATRGPGFPTAAKHNFLL